MFEEPMENRLDCSFIFICLNCLSLSSLSVTSNVPVDSELLTLTYQMMEQGEGEGESLPAKSEKV